MVAWALKIEYLMISVLSASATLFQAECGQVSVC